MFVHKVDDEIYLKLIDFQDAEAVFRLTEESRAYLREWLPWLDTIKRIEDTKVFIETSAKGFAENKSMNTVIFYKDQVAGIAGFNELDWANKIAYIGYWLGKDFQGYGIMTRVVRSLTEYAFRILNFNRVEIRAAVANSKSRAIPERLGYSQEGIIHDAEWLYDHYVDHVVYGMLKKQWNQE